MQIEIISFGKSKEQNIFQAEEEYLKRLKKEYSITLTQLPQGKNSSSPAATMLEEAKNLINHLKEDSKLIILDEYGPQMTSKEFANFLQKHKNNATQHLVFAVGGPYGWDDSIRNKANFSLSLSKLTFPAHIAKFLLIEQLYRASSILNGHPYHK